jgi:hypothetical protein
MGEDASSYARPKIRDFSSTKREINGPGRFNVGAKTTPTGERAWLVCVFARIAALLIVI